MERQSYQPIKVEISYTCKFFKNTQTCDCIARAPTKQEAPASEKTQTVSFIPSENEIRCRD